MGALDLPLIWAGLIAIAVALYVVLDGFDLGIGILFPLANPRERDVMTASIAPVWDGNETWLILGGGGLFAAFPLAYATLMPAMYMPIILMLVALIFRGVAFEFRVKAGPSGRGKAFWTAAFAGGSLVAALAQGLVLGGFLQGVKVEGRAFAGGAFDWLTPYSLLVAAGLVCGYALLGATWLILKTDGDLQVKARLWAGRLFIAVAVAMAGVSIATLNIDPRVTARWGVTMSAIDWPTFVQVAPAPLLAALSLASGFFAARGIRQLVPFLCAVGAFIAGFVGLATSVFPNIVPFELTIREAAAAPNAQGLMLVGTVIMLPIILGYTGYLYWVFRGKARADAFYH